MSGHSKWHNIQARKGKQDALRSNLFSSYGKKIRIVAKTGGGDPATNFSLRLILEKAKAAGMPKDNIERAVKQGTGELTDGAQVEELLYEAYGPGGVAIIIKVLTDNKNRTAPEIKHLLSQYGGSLGSSGSVQWMFQQWGVAALKKEALTAANVGRDDFEMQMIEVGAEDIQDDEDEIVVKTKIENLQKVILKLQELKIETSRSGLEWIAKDKVPVGPEVQEKLSSLFEKMEENEDIDEYFTNAD